MGEIIRLPGLSDYEKTLNLQLKTQNGRITGEINDKFYILEHKPVFTLGKRGGEENLLKERFFLDLNGVSIYKTNRGGNITYHGPGQMIIYPIINIKKLGIGIKKYIEKLEDIVIELGLLNGVICGRDSRNRGVWIDDSKVASIGISVSQGVTMHGIAVNINTDLTPFSWINPCGLKGVSAIGFKDILGKELNMTTIKDQTEVLIKKKFRECFSYE